MPYETLGREPFEGVLAMLAGAYPSDEFAELKARIVWDRVSGVVEGRRDARVVAVTSGGTIPDRGLYGVFLVGEPGTPGRRVGELDEEMVYESRVGEVITLGASAWRIEEISHDRVIVSPAPGEPGKLPFWHGDAVGRPIELGRALGAFVGGLEADLGRGSRGRSAALARLGERHDLDPLASENLLAYLEDERAVAGALPTDRRIVVERFRDELGDWRLCLLTPFGGRVHAPWSLALEARLAERFGAEVQTIWSDDGIAIRLPDGELDGIEELLFPDPDEIEELVVGKVGRFGAVRGALPRERRPRPAPAAPPAGDADPALAAAPAGRRPARRGQPLRQLPDPRRDVPRVPVRRLRPAGAARGPGRGSPAARSPSTGSRRSTPRRSRARSCSTTSPPTCTRATPRSPSGGPRRSPWIATCCASCSARRSCASSSTRRRWPTSSSRCRAWPTSAGRRRSTSSTTSCAGSATCPSSRWPRAARFPLRERGLARASSRPAGGPSPCAIAGEPRWIAIEDVARYRDAVGVQPPAGVPLAFLGSAAAALEGLLARFARTHGPFLSPEPATRWGLPLGVVEDALGRLVANGALLRGEFRPGGAEREWCDPEVLRQLRRRSLARLRREVEPVEPAALGRFLPDWQGVAPLPGSGRAARSRRRSAARRRSSGWPRWSTSSPGCRSRPRSSSATSCRRGSPATSRGCSTSSARSARWPGSAGAASAATTAGWPCSAPGARRSGRPVGPAPSRRRSPSDRADRGTRRSGHSSPGAGRRSIASSTPPPVADRTARCSTRCGTSSGRASSRTTRSRRSAPCAGPAPAARRAAEPGRLTSLGPPEAAGRWSLVADDGGERGRHAAAPPAERATTPTPSWRCSSGTACVTREAVIGEGIAGGFGGIYPVLRALEEAGRIRRGYFVDGLGAAQFALPGAIDRLRAVREPAEAPGRARVHLLAAADPANPYGAALAWPRRDDDDRRAFARVAGAYVVLVDGVAALYLERGGRTLTPFPAAADDAVAAMRSGRSAASSPTGASVSSS